MVCIVWSGIVCFVVVSCVVLVLLCLVCFMLGGFSAVLAVNLGWVLLAVG